MLIPLWFGVEWKKFSEPVEDICYNKTVKKLFLSFWTDGENDGYPFLNKYNDHHVIYDAEEDDPVYHKRVLER